MSDPRFAAYEPDRSREPDPSREPDQPPEPDRSRERIAVSVRVGAPADIANCLRIARQNGPFDEVRREAGLRASIGAADAELFVAECPEAKGILGYGRVRRLDGDQAPSGWYLIGATVAREHRRRGVGRALTRHRLDWIFARAEEAWYFANSANRASIDLHRAFGFVQVDRDFVVPGVEFANGEGVLFRLTRSDNQPMG